MKRKVYETDSVSTQHEMKSFFAMIRGLFPEIDAFIGSQSSLGNSVKKVEKICCLNSDVRTWE